MRQAHMDGGLALEEGTLQKLHLNMPAGGWFPTLQSLSWCITRRSLPYATLLFPPHLKKVSFSISHRDSDIPHDIVPAITSTISLLPAFALQSLHVGTSRCKIPWAHFKDSLSSVVLRCGSSLIEFASPVPLSNEAINRLIQLPHLHILRIEGPPPSYPSSSLPLVFPPLTELTLGEGAACGWLSLFKRLENSTSIAQGVTPLSKVRESLESLDIENLPGLIINASFIFPVRAFQNLACLNVETYCHDKHGVGRCTFKLNDDDVAELAMALPRLESLLLGHACFKNACATTVACLLPVSVHCVGLQSLDIHFNTTNIVRDFENLFEDPRLQELRLLPRCTLSYLVVNQTPLTLDEPGFETVVNGMVDIFPSLERCDGLDRIWDELSGRIMDLWET
jgi:hypothetical protein